ncbi:MAG: histone deacetylase family protein, partial [Pseudomonadota bacterium]|nr:histone deacetylase family protein [Pseudomonadota bacterium]
VLAALKAPEFAELQWHDAPLGTREQVLRVHTAAYVDQVEALSPSDGLRALDGGDTMLSPGSLEAALRGVGAACAAVDAVVGDRNASDVTNAFCATRPCGHHAESDHAMGFCIYNQAAIAALHARATHGLQRVAVVDFDVHHGNGTQNSFWDDPDLFYGSSHQADFYPGTGAQHETGSAHNIVNIPLRRGCDSDAFRARFAETMLPALRDFAPELLIISAGFDAHGDDALGGLRLTDDDFHWVTAELMKVADVCCSGRVVSVLEGGYSVDGLAGGTRAHVRALMGK